VIECVPSASVLTVIAARVAADRNLAGLATVVGFDRERAFYPTVMIVIASYYVLFAAMWFDPPLLVDRGLFS
jgi:hypothetical protein